MVIHLPHVRVPCRDFTRGAERACETVHLFCDQFSARGLKVETETAGVRPHGTQAFACPAKGQRTEAGVPA